MMQYPKTDLAGGRSEWILTQLRLLLIFLALLLYASGNISLNIAPGFAALVLGVALAYVATLYVVLPRYYQPRWRTRWSIVLTLIDAALVSFAVVITGGPASPAAMFYLPLIFGATLRFSRRDANRVATIMILSYVLVVMFQAQATILANGVLLATVLTHILLFGAVALLGGVVIVEVQSERQKRQTAQQRYEDSLLLQQISQRLHSSLHLSTVAENIIHQIHHMMPEARCAVRLASDENYWHGLEPHEAEVLRTWDAATGFGAKVIEFGTVTEIIGLGDLPGGLPDTETWAVTDTLGIQTLLIVPLAATNDCEGLLYVGYPEREFPPAERVIIRALAIGAGAAIANARRYQAERDTVTKLHHIAKLKSEFVMMIGHELRTPLTSIKGFAQLLRRQEAPNAAQVQRAANVIIQQSEKLIEIVAIILNISRLESGLLELRRQPLRLGTLTEQMASAVLGGQGRRYILDVPPELPPVRCDPQRTQRALLHLLDNACKYSPSETPVYIKLTAEADGVVVSVHDQGNGIPAEQLNMLFGSYSDSEVPENFNRSGMGIYEARNCIEAQGGKLWAESQPGNGSTFYIKLGF